MLYVEKRILDKDYSHSKASITYPAGTEMWGITDTKNLRFYYFGKQEDIIEVHLKPWAYGNEGWALTRHNAFLTDLDKLGYWPLQDTTFVANCLPDASNKKSLEI